MSLPIDESEAATERKLRRRGLPLLFGVLVLYKFSRDFREAATVEVKREFFGSYANAAAICGYFDTANVVIIFATAPLLACLSDAVGRHGVLIWETVAIFVPALCLLLGLSFWWYLVTDNLLPGDQCAIYAFVADVTHTLSPADRAFAFGVAEASLAVGSLLGYVLHGALAPTLPHSAIFGAAGAAAAIAIALAVMLPESLPPARRCPFRLRDANPCGVLGSLARHRHALGAYFVIYSLAQFADLGYDTVLDMDNAERFGIRLRRYDAYWVTVTIAEIAATVGLLRVIGCRCRPGGVLVLGLLLTAVAYAIQGLARGLPAAYAAGLLHSAGAIWSPGLMALVVADVSADQEGAAQGALTSVASLVAVGAPVIFGTTLRKTTVAWPGSVWTLAAGPTLLAAAIAAGRWHPAAEPVAHIPLASAADFDSSDEGDGVDIPSGSAEVPDPTEGRGRGWLLLLLGIGIANASIGVWLTVAG